MKTKRNTFDDDMILANTLFALMRIPVRIRKRIRNGRSSYQAYFTKDGRVLIPKSKMAFVKHGETITPFGIVLELMNVYKGNEEMFIVGRAFLNGNRYAAAKEISKKD